jgi:hypothetical protein
LNSPELHRLFARNFVLVNLDEQENPGADKFLAEMGGARSGVPFIVFLDKAGKKIADSNAMPGGNNIGCPATPEEVAAFDKLLARTAPRLSAAERARISDYFTKNAPKRRAEASP